MDFDNAKENIQPLAAGRNLRFLHAALNTDSRQAILEQRKALEAAIDNYDGVDPIAPWFEYILWIEQSFPSGGKESGLEEVLIKCLQLFENDKRYSQDSRLIKLYIKFIDSHENPQECYQELYNQGIGTMVAELYICWAYYYDLAGNHQKADSIYRKGLDAKAQPYDDLDQAHKQFGFAMSQRILHNDESSQQSFLTSMKEKRQALTSLRSHRKYVGSIRTGAAVKSYAPGRVQSGIGQGNSQQNIDLQVFTDENEDPAAVVRAPEEHKSIVSSIVDSTRKQENYREPGPWSKAQKDHKKSVFGSSMTHELAFDILEDSCGSEKLHISTDGGDNLSKGIILPDGFVRKNSRQESWHLAITVENSITANTLPSYKKCYLYPKPNLEFAPEELLAYNWFRKRKIENKFTKERDLFWDNGVTSGVRTYPNFSKNNLPQPEFKTETVIVDEANTTGKTVFAINVKCAYPEDFGEEYQFEEILCKNFQDGKRKVKFRPNQTIAVQEEMDETICINNDNRRKSFFPPRMSMHPGKTEKRECVEEASANLSNTPERKLGNSYVSTFTPPPIKVMKLDENEPQHHSPERKPPKVSFANDFQFKTPAPVSVKPKLGFQIYEEEDDAPNFEANETCSTQMFNCFIQSQSVSTPKSVKTVSLFSRPIAETSLNSAPLQTLSPPDYTEGNTLHCKQLSTIMETSEPIGGTTGSTKSSVDTHIGSPEFDGESSKLTTISNITHDKSETLKQSEDMISQMLTSMQFHNDISTKKLNSTLSGEVDSPKSTFSPDVSCFETSPIPSTRATGNALSCVVAESPEPVSTSNQSSHWNQLQTSTATKILITENPFEEISSTTSKMGKLGDISRMETAVNNVPKIGALKYFEDKTETIPKIMLSKKEKPAPIKSKTISEDELFDFFTKSPGKATSITKSSCFQTDDLRAELPKISEKNKSLFNATSFFEFGDDEPKKKNEQPEVPKNSDKNKSLFSASSFFKFDDDEPKNNALEQEAPKMSDKNKSMLSASNFLGFNDDDNGKQKDPGPIITKISNKDKSIFSASNFFEFGDTELKKKVHQETEMKTKNMSTLSASNFFEFGDEEPRKKDQQSELAKGSDNNKSIFSASNFLKFNADEPRINQLELGPTKGSDKNKSIFSASDFFEFGDDDPKKKYPELPKSSDNNKSILSASSFFGLSDEGPKKNEKSQSSGLSFVRSKVEQSFYKDNSEERKNTSLSFTSNSKSNLSFMQALDAPAIKDATIELSKQNIEMPTTALKLSITENKPKNRNSAFDVSIKPEDFFEENIGTFVPNMSMIKNSTWLPNHGPRYSQIQHASIHIKEEIVELNESVNVDTSNHLKRFPKSQNTSDGLKEDIVFDLTGPEDSHQLSRKMMPPPMLPMAIKKSPVEIRDHDMPREYDDENDLGRSIYFQKTPQTPKMTRHAWDDLDEGNMMETEFQHKMIDLNQTKDIIEHRTVADNINPFDGDLISAFLDQLDFCNYIDSLPNCELIGNLTQLRKGASVMINDKKFECIKLIGEGSYGSIYLCKDIKTGELVALKQEKPANLFEFYIGLELNCRINNPDILPGFMKIDYALIGNNASIFVSKYSPYGSLIAVCNQIKKVTMKTIDEYVVMHLSSQLIAIMDHMHAANIIHADVKADNFLLMSRLTYGEKSPSVQLIDFGVSIDMVLFKKGQTFNFIHSCDDFKCIEMRENRNWTYQIDLFGLASVIHVLLYGKYLDVVKKPITGRWEPKTRMPRYIHKTIWTTIFDTLLNVKDCRTMPNLQNLRTLLEEEMVNKERYVRDKIREFNFALEQQ